MERERGKLLIIDDSGGSLAVVAREADTGFELVCVSGCERALEHARLAEPTVILMAGNGEEFAACRRLRADSGTRDVLVFLVGADSEQFRVSAFEALADDVIPQDIGARELQARVFARLQRFARQRSGDRLVCGNLLIDLARLEASINGQRIQLTSLELRLLRYFVEHSERVLERDELLVSVWGDDSVTARTVDTHVAQLRKKLSAFNHGIHTIYGAGYILRPK